MKLLRRFTPPTRTAFDKAGQAVIDDIYRILNERTNLVGASRGEQPTRAPVLQVFASVAEARTFFQELNINTLHAVATRTGSLTIDNLLTMSEGSQIYNADSYNITDQGIMLEAPEDPPGLLVDGKRALRFVYDVSDTTPAITDIAATVSALWELPGATPVNAALYLSAGYDGSSYLGTIRLKAANIAFEGAVTFGAMSFPYVTKTANYTATTSDHTIDCTSGTFTVTLYAAAGNAGRELRIINSGSGTITVDGNASETINGDFTKTLLTDDAMSIVCTGSGWRIV